MPELKSYFSKDLLEAGLDEAGRGCLAGPVVAAFVILPSDYKNPQLDDSKQVPKKVREQLREEILKEAIDYGIAEVCNRTIDKINILNASFLAMHRALDQSKCCPDLLLVDGNRFRKYKTFKHECIVDGDANYLSIAAASILAKTFRDDLMAKLDQQYPSYDWKNNAGYGTPRHREAISAEGLTPYHRFSFNISNSQYELFN